MADRGCKEIENIETDKVSLTVVECNCGFHLGVDGTWLTTTHEKGLTFVCPACSNEMYIEAI